MVEQNIQHEAVFGWSERKAMVVGIAIAISAFSIVNFWVYRALVVYADNNPDIIAQGPVTVSRAITDPDVSHLFAFWIAVAAFILPIGMGIVGLMHVRLGRRNAKGGRLLVRTGQVVIPLQIAASIGMVILSVYRFPDHDELHMFGSFVFFISQSLVMIMGYLGALTIHKLALHDIAPLAPKGQRLRLWLGPIGIALVVSYGVLFKIKGWDLGAWDTTVYRTYTTVEPALITCFLVFYISYLTDMASRLRRA